METWGERIELLLPFQVNEAMMAAAGNPRVKFMHCLPAFHNSETAVGARIAAQYPLLSNGIEVTDEVFRVRRTSRSNRLRSACTPSRPSSWLR